MMMNKNSLLLLIRNEKSITYAELCNRLGLHPDSYTVIGFMLGNLELLYEAGLVEINPPINDIYFAAKNAEKIVITITPLLSKIQRALNISLTELASTNEQNRITVTPSLYRYLPPKFQNDLFVLMPFAQEFQPVYEDHLKQVAESLNLTIARADNFFSRGVVINQIWSAIFNSKIIVADLTGRNPNVFYEVGLAHAIGKSLILITQDKDDIPFDLRHLRIVFYKFTPRGMKDLEEELKNIINTTIKESN